MLSQSVLFAAGQVISIVGNVSVMENDTAAEKTLNYNDTVQTGATIVTKENSKVKILFDDKSVITVGASSKLKNVQQVFDEKKRQRQTKMKLLFGKVRSLVSKVKNLLDSRFEVETSNGIAGVRGTYFVVQDNGSQTQIFTLEGNVVMQPNGGGAVEVPANFSFTIENQSAGGNGGDQPAGGVKPITPEQFNTLEQETNVGEDPAPTTINPGANAGEAPPPWFQGGGQFGPGGPGPGSGEHPFFQQFFSGPGQGQGPVFLPPINQQPPGSNLPSTSVDIHVNGLPSSSGN